MTTGEVLDVRAMSAVDITQLCLCLQFISTALTVTAQNLRGLRASQLTYNAVQRLARRVTAKRFANSDALAGRQSQRSCSASNCLVYI